MSVHEFSPEILEIFEIYGWPEDEPEFSPAVAVVFKDWGHKSEHWRTQLRDARGRWVEQWSASLPTDPFGDSAFVASKPPPSGGSTRFTVSPYGDSYAVFDNGVFHSAPESGTWGAAKKIANRLNDSIREVKMKYQPQLAKDGGTTFQSGPEWVVERKWDGLRAIFEISEDETRIFSRTGQDLRPQFPELVNLHETLPPSILDGEIIALDENGVEQLELLQLRAGDKKARRKDEIPVNVKFFDVLESRGKPTLDLPVDKRKSELEDLVGKEYMVETLPVGATVKDIPSHWEGTVSKLKDSKYEVGKRRATWLKYKFKKTATLRVTGLTPGLGARKNSFGAVMVSDANGVPRGQVGSGFTQEDIDTLLRARETGDWPLIEVEYRFLSKTGLLTNTAYKGIRHDKDEADLFDEESGVPDESATVTAEEGSPPPKKVKDPSNKIKWWETELANARAAGDPGRVSKAEAKLAGLRKYAAQQITVDKQSVDTDSSLAKYRARLSRMSESELDNEESTLIRDRKFLTDLTDAQVSDRLAELDSERLARFVGSMAQQSTESPVLSDLRSYAGSFVTKHMPKTFSGWKLHINTGGDLEKEASIYEALRPLVEEQGMGLKLATQKFQDTVAGGHPQAGKDITIYLPRRNDAKEHSAKIIEALKGFSTSGDIQNDEMLAPGVGLRFEFGSDPGRDVSMEDYRYHYVSAGSSPNLPLPTSGPGPDASTADRISYAIGNDPTLADMYHELAWRLYEEDEDLYPGQWDITAGGGGGQSMAVSEYAAEIEAWLTARKRKSRTTKPASEVLVYNTEKLDTKIAKGVKDAAAAIDAVHYMPGDIGGVAVRHVVGTDLGKYRYHRELRKPLSIDLNKDESGANVTAVHEVGHFLDHWGIEPDLRGKGKWASESYSSDATQVLAAAYRSKGFLKLKSWERRDPEYYDYLSDPKEVFARAYSQWISLRSGKIKGVKNRVGQWTDEDFQPIAEALDALFAEKGLLKVDL